MEKATRLDSALWTERVEPLLCGPYFLHTKKMDLPYKPLPATILDFLPAIPRENKNASFLSECIPPPASTMKQCFPDLCDYCGGKDLRIILREGLFVCAECGLQNSMASDEYVTRPPRSRKRSSPRIHQEMMYKRANHFRYWLRRIQGEEHQIVSEHVVQKVKECIRNNEPTYERVKSALRILHEKKYYNNVIQIIARISGEPLLKLSSENEAILLDYFYQVQAVYSQCMGARVNMLFYPYLIKKFCELQGWTQAADSIPQLKSRSKIYQQDIIWERICNKKGWDFTKSV